LRPFRKGRRRPSAYSIPFQKLQFVGAARFKKLPKVSISFRDSGLINGLQASEGKKILERGIASGAPLGARPERLRPPHLVHFAPARRALRARFSDGERM
jgi:hypothetical protein